jgi:putative oxidoreductase
MFKNVLTMKFFPANRDAGLLALRLAGILPLLLKHGLEKIFTFSAMASHFPDPLHIGAVPSLLCAALSDAICSTLMIVGLATRWAALISFINIFVAWAFVHHFQFFGRGADHGELVVLFLAILLTIILAGPGKYSIDAVIDRRGVFGVRVGMCGYRL